MRNQTITLNLNLEKIAETQMKILFTSTDITETQIIDFSSLQEYTLRLRNKLSSEDQQERNVAEDIDKQLREFGQFLFEQVIQINTVIHKFYRDVVSLYKLRLNICVSDPQLIDIPWESMYDPVVGYISLSEKFHLIRYFLEKQSDKIHFLKFPLRVLVIMPECTNLPKIEADKHWKSLWESTNKLRVNNQLILDRLELGDEENTLISLQKYLQKNKCNLVYFVGHGEYSDKKGSFLQFQHQYGYAIPVTGEVLAKELIQNEALGLVILNSCNSIRNLSQDPFAGVGTALVAKGIPAVIGMQFPMNLKASRMFTEILFSSLDSGRNLTEALYDIRRALLNGQFGTSWLNPVLLLNSSYSELSILNSKGRDGSFTRVNPAIFIDKILGKKYKSNVGATKSRATVFKKRSLSIEVILIPEGNFIMGSSEMFSNYPDNEKPEHPQYTNRYYISKYPITNYEYLQFIKNNPDYKLPRTWINNSYPQGKAFHPVSGVSLVDVRNFCMWLGVRLPTEIEWEKAARGDDRRLFPWGDEFSSSYCNCWEANINGTTDVSRYSHIDSFFGVCDLLGNVWEWTSSPKSNYPIQLHTRKQINEAQLSQYVLRGGSYRSDSKIIRSTVRIFDSPLEFRLDYGFRIVVDKIT